MAGVSALAPWLQPQLQALLAQRGHVARVAEQGGRLGAVGAGQAGAQLSDAALWPTRTN